MKDITKFGTEVFIKAVSLKRSHASAGEIEFVDYLLSILPNPSVDAVGNIHVDLRDNLDVNKTLFTAHTDTVHRSSDFSYYQSTSKKKKKKKNKYLPQVVTDTKVNLYDYDAEKNHIKACGDVLGADDATGIAILVSMIKSGVKGYYIFFRGEERGGIGSSWLAKNNPELLKQFNRAVAFDRANYYDVITHQGGSRCCSDAFANALASKLSTDEHWYIPSDGGVYTDTAEFIGIIPECTNLSVGYFNQHTHSEYQNMSFLDFLIERSISIDWDDLPTERDPSVVENKYDLAPWYNMGSYTTTPSSHSKTALNAFDWNDIAEPIVSASELYYALDRATRGDFKQLEDAMYDYSRGIDISIKIDDIKLKYLDKYLLRDYLTLLEDDCSSYNAEYILDTLMEECYTMGYNF